MKISIFTMALVALLVLPQVSYAQTNYVDPAYARCAGKAVGDKCFMMAGKEKKEGVCYNVTKNSDLICVPHIVTEQNKK